MGMIAYTHTYTNTHTNTHIDICTKVFIEGHTHRKRDKQSYITILDVFMIW